MGSRGVRSVGKCVKYEVDVGVGGSVDWCFYTDIGYGIVIDVGDGVGSGDSKQDKLSFGDKIYSKDIRSVNKDF